ncbi:lipoprotein signal peptidase [Kordia sp. YSTF-M3]|uniref:Lipoprotein signal peptidase n=1 Tax=Kordia aestuariivivens TaxID=2759037 RepID=A0ABR7Q9E0_9FLAO|nr:lipoprotein signal peptidase [Kordia aestuariivivens]MBC8755191.1 lipoprotein signal peptidase [Kordia aestuariivivens]
MSLKKAIGIIVLILLIDQISKIYIKTNFALGESVEVFGWFKILFVENKGMAWGVELPGSYGKLFLTLFRLFAITAIGYWLYDSVKKKSSKILIVAIALIFAGAFGNIIDSVFYGIIFNESVYQGEVASFMPEAGGYAPVFHGHVVDMLYFPMIDTTWPEWVPWLGGDRLSFFDPVFNIADSAITIGVLLLIIFNKKAFPKKPVTAKEIATEEISE